MFCHYILCVVILCVLSFLLLLDSELVQVGSGEMVSYELVLVARRTDYASLLRRYSDVILSSGGLLRKFENLGIRKLSYPIKAHQQTYQAGKYLRVEFDAPPALPKELDRRLRIDEDIVRHLIVKADGFATAAAARDIPTAYPPSSSSSSSSYSSSSSPSSSHSSSAGSRHQGSNHHQHQPSSSAQSPSAPSHA
ncbi:mitochondrial ribosomal protein S6 (bS6m) [Andalucia godoyi]|uniref:Mitochondrial ribosomal protein S6 (BS6m) n=1 Tax=Andalucia godoyi TaxID=505711 RepID=A0A8K0F4J7_ANDGO|nr:mitochondrial ribosomal protein S6 (bS6m) [Andalucia godoyi]|eukprot:ANDGO_04075.mRNA.1 mitochondrial ribosomal protein S6 (bS6m)